MQCHAQGRCRFCRKRHILPVLGSDEIAHALLREPNSKLVIDDFLKKIDLRLSPVEVNEIHGTVTDNPTESTDRDISSDNLDFPSGTQVRDRSLRQAQSAIDRMGVDSATTDDARAKTIASISVEGDERYGVGIDDSRVTREQDNQNAERARRRKRRRLACDFCQKEFNHAGDLNKHRRTHTGEQPYACNGCQQRFSHASNLARHRRVHSGERPFSCRTCGRTFTRKDKLSAHLTAERCYGKF